MDTPVILEPPDKADSYWNIQFTSFQSQLIEQIFISMNFLKHISPNAVKTSITTLYVITISASRGGHFTVLQRKSMEMRFTLLKPTFMYTFCCSYISI